MELRVRTKDKDDILSKIKLKIYAYTGKVSRNNIYAEKRINEFFFKEFKEV